MRSVQPRPGARASPESGRRTTADGGGLRGSMLHNSRRPLLRRLLGGLNELLKLSDFSRGDIFRD